MFIVGYKCMYRALCKLVYLNKMCAFACTNIVVLQDELSTIKKLAVAISTLRVFFFVPYSFGTEYLLYPWEHYPQEVAF